jgi:CheY-like chemotaxis protein
MRSVSQAARESFPIGREFPASLHAIGLPLPHTEHVTVSERTRCVIVDDNRDFLDTATRLLEHQGISVVAVAMSSAEGLQQVENLRPDVTLVDVNLGEESGFDLVEKLHRNGFGPSAPAILISTHAEDDFAELISDSPALAFIPKAALSGAAIRDALGVDS